MPDITIRIRDKVAEVVGEPRFVCGNAGYHAIFDLDDEWSGYQIKTMRVAWTDTFSGQPRHTDVPFILGFAEIPAIADAYEISIGLYAGSIKTSTPARIACERCVTDGGTYHEDPDHDTYAALLELLDRVTHAGGVVGDTTVLLDGVARGTVGIPTFPSLTTIDLLTTEPYASNIEQGGFADATGEPTEKSNRVRCASFITIPDGSTGFTVRTKISGADERYFVYLYGADEAYLYNLTRSSDPQTGGAYWSHVASGTWHSVPDDAYKLRVVVRKDNNEDFTPEDVGQFQIIFI